MKHPDHLVIVCGHAVWKGGPKLGWDEGEWLIESYKRGETPTFIEHIKAGLRVLAQDEGAVLVFSGAPTRKGTTLSEARSYHNVAIANSYFGLPFSSLPTPRILHEERALDSYGNILFSLVLFWRHHAVWPARLTLVSHAFKRTRLVDGHCAAIGFPLDRVHFVGINPPGIDEMFSGSTEMGGNVVSQEKTDAMQGVQLAMGQWESDPHGVGAELAGKRKARNLWGVDQKLFESEEERARSRVATRLLEDGRSEVLVEDGAPRPWARADVAGGLQA